MGIGEIAAFGGIEQGNGQVHVAARGVGRPSTVVQYAPQIAEWLRESPALSGAEILRRVRVTGYRGGKSALYELVRRVRLAASGN
jgi:hypothetical protein